MRCNNAYEAQRAAKGRNGTCHERAAQHGPETQGLQRGTAQSGEFIAEEHQVQAFELAEGQHETGQQQAPITARPV